MLHDPIEPGVGDPRRLAAEGEEPTFRLGPGNWKAKFPELLQHVVWTREAAREKYCTKVPSYDFMYLKRRFAPIEISEGSASNEGAKSS